MTRLSDQVHSNPMSWKDYLNAGATLCTLAALLVMGGKIIEQLERARADVAELSADVGKLRQDLSQQQLQLGTQQGLDRLREEQINTIRRDLDTLVRRPR